MSISVAMSHRSPTKDVTNNAGNECNEPPTPTNTLGRALMGPKKGEHHEGSRHTYMQHKNAKIIDQHSTSNPATHTPDSNAKQQIAKRIFDGVVMYVDGLTNGASLHDLRDMVLLGGGQSSHFLSNEHVTHVVANNLTDAKALKEVVTKRRFPIKFVLPAWVIDSVSQSKRLSERDYVLPEVLPQGGNRITSHFVFGQHQKKKDAREAEEGEQQQQHIKNPNQRNQQQNITATSNRQTTKRAFDELTSNETTKARRIVHEIFDGFEASTGSKIRRVIDGITPPTSGISKRHGSPDTPTSVLDPRSTHIGGGSSHAGEESVHTSIRSVRMAESDQSTLRKRKSNSCKRNGKGKRRATQAPPMFSVTDGDDGRFLLVQLSLPTTSASSSAMSLSVCNMPWLGVAGGVVVSCNQSAIRRGVHVGFPSDVAVQLCSAAHAGCGVVGGVETSIDFDVEEVDPVKLHGLTERASELIRTRDTVQCVECLSWDAIAVTCSSPPSTAQVASIRQSLEHNLSNPSCTIHIDTFISLHALRTSRLAHTISVCSTATMSIATSEQNPLQGRIDNRSVQSNHSHADLGHVSTSVPSLPFRELESSWLDLPVAGIPELRVDTRSQLIKRGLVSIGEVIDAATEAERRQRRDTYCQNELGEEENERIRQLRRDDEFVLEVAKLCCQGLEGQQMSQSTALSQHQNFVQTNSDTDGYVGRVVSGRWFGLTFADDILYISYVNECAQTLADAVFNASRGSYNCERTEEHSTPGGIRGVLAHNAMVASNLDTDQQPGQQPNTTRMKHLRGELKARLRVRHKLPGETGHEVSMAVVYGSDVYEALRVACVDLALQVVFKASGGLPAVAGLIFELVSSSDIRNANTGRTQLTMNEEDDDIASNIDDVEFVEHVDVSTPISPSHARVRAQLLETTSVTGRRAQNQSNDCGASRRLTIVDLASPFTQNSAVTEDDEYNDGSVGIRNGYIGRDDNDDVDEDDNYSMMPESFSQITSEAKQNLPPEMRRELRNRLRPHRQQQGQGNQNATRDRMRMQYGRVNDVDETEGVLIVGTVKLPLTLIGSLAQRQVAQLQDVRRSLVNTNAKSKSRRGGAKSTNLGLLGWAKRPELNRQLCECLQVRSGSELYRTITSVDDQAQLRVLIETVLGWGAGNETNLNTATTNVPLVRPRRTPIPLAQHVNAPIAVTTRIHEEERPIVVDVQREVARNDMEEAVHVPRVTPVPYPRTESVAEVDENEALEIVDAGFDALEVGEALKDWMKRVGCPSRLTKENRQGGPVLEFVKQLLAQNELVAAHLAIRVFCRLCSERDCDCRGVGGHLPTHWVIFSGRVERAVADVLVAQGLGPFADIPAA